MRTRTRYLIYGLGFAIGYAIVSMFFSGSIISIKTPSGDTEKTRSSNVLLGEIVYSRKPLPVSWALFYRNFPKDAEGQFERVMVFEGTHAVPYWRVVEKLQSIEGGYSHATLISRSIMAADRIVVELPKEVDKFTLESALQGAQLVVSGPLSGEEDQGNSYLVQLPTHGPMSVPENIEKIDLLTKGLVKITKPYFFLDLQEES